MRTSYPAVRSASFSSVVRVERPEFLTEIRIDCESTVWARVILSPGPQFLRARFISEAKNWSTGSALRMFTVRS